MDIHTYIRDIRLNPENKANNINVTQFKIRVMGDVTRLLYCEFCSGSTQVETRCTRTRTVAKYSLICG